MQRKYKYIGIAAGSLALILVVLLRVASNNAHAGPREENSFPPAAVALVKRTSISNTVTLSGEFVPFQQVDVHAKVAGYIREIVIDVGDHVRAGQTLAVLEVPELSAQLQGADAAVRRSQDAIRRSKSDLDRTASLHAAAHSDYARLEQASQTRPGLIAQQELDDVQAKDKEGEAQMSADEAALSEAGNELEVALAEQKRLSALTGYTRITAPFDGVVTRRYVDKGALVQAGTSSNTQALPVVSVAETDLFRLTLPVPESAVPTIHTGTAVTVHVPALNRNFEGRVSRFADAVNQETRTMHTEVDVHNPDGSIVQGMYAEVTLTLTKTDDALTVPIQAVTRNGSQASVLVVNAQDRIEPHDVQLGMEQADSIQVISGLNPNEKVVIGSPSEFRPGERVVPRMIAENREGQF
jgi:RND family efflux transporter MFP subunit